MLRDTAIALITDRFNRSDLTTRAIAEMQLLQNSLEGEAFLPWFMVSAEQSLATAANVATVAVPADFLRECDEDETALYLIDADGAEQFLDKGTYGVLAQKYKDDVAQQPLEYALVNDKFYFFPTPDAVYQLRLTYYAAQTILDSNIENSWLKWAPDLMIAGTGLQLAKYPGNTELAQMFKADFAAAMDGLLRHDTARREAAMDRHMGDEDA